MKNLKVKCTLCGKEEIDKETVKEVAGIIEKCGLKSEHYLYLLNVMSGKCLDSDEHSFIFDEAFLKEIEELIKKYKDSSEEIRKLRVVNEGIRKESDELHVKAKELDSKYGFNNDRINNLYDFMGKYKNEIEESTGYKNIDIWQ